MTKTAYPELFARFTSDNLSLKNKIIMAPMTRGQSPNNVPSKDVAHYYKRRAEGGAGLIITECTFIDHPVSNGFENAPAFYGEDALAGWKNVVEEVHRAGGKIIPQLWHAGSSRSLEISPIEAIPSIGPIDVFDGEEKVVEAMSQNDIKDVVVAFTKAAVDAKGLGFDGVEIHGAHSYLIDQFLWSDSNKRGDEYGGSEENRVRFACEIVSSIRSAVGSGFPIIFRFSQWKLTDYTAKIANTPIELERILKPLAASGVDIFHVSTRRFWQPEFSGSTLSLAGWTKNITGKPVIAVGSVGIDTQFSLDMFSEVTQSQPTSLDLVEEKLKNGEFDLVAVGRAILADSNWPHKIRSGALDNVIPFSSDLLGELF